MSTQGMSRAGCAAVALMAAAAIAAPFFLKPFGIYLISMWAVLTVAAIGLNLTLGYAGQVSLAQGAFVGIGAYAVALLTRAGCPYALAFIAAGGIGFAIGWLLGYPALRVQHHYLAFVTLAFTTLVFLVLRNEEWLTGGTYGIDDVARPAFFGWSPERRDYYLFWSTERPRDYCFFCLGTLAVLATATWWMLRSPWGRAFVALRENPVRALSLGVDTRRYTLMAFAIGSSLGGLAGALYAPLVQYIEPASFALGLSFNLLLMVIVGGSGHFFGPFVGALIAVLLPEWTRNLVAGYYLILYAGLVMVMMAFRPTGIMGLVDSVRKAAGAAASRRCARRAPSDGAAATAAAPTVAP
jgi:branched-chain amino acid transport system permease protein